MKKPSRADILRVFEYNDNFKVGYQRCHQALVSSGYPISEWDVRKIYEAEGLYNYEYNYVPKDVHTSRFVALYAGQIWHTDLHYWEIKIGNDIRKWNYLIGFIDDRTRFIVHAAVINEKTSINAATELEIALQNNKLPHTIVTDNGKEFIGEPFQKVLKDHNIACHRTNPYSPQENGKMERWWKTLEGSILNHDSLNAVINEYNNVWHHRALKDLTGKNITPREAWEQMERWEGKDDLGIKYTN